MGKHLFTLSVGGQLTASSLVCTGSELHGASSSYLCLSTDVQHST